MHQEITILIFLHLASGTSSQSQADRYFLGFSLPDAGRFEVPAWSARHGKNTPSFCPILYEPHETFSASPVYHGWEAHLFRHLQNIIKFTWQRCSSNRKG